MQDTSITTDILPIQARPSFMFHSKVIATDFSLRQQKWSLRFPEKCRMINKFVFQCTFKT